jgi:hypothetical protein
MIAVLDARELEAFARLMTRALPGQSNLLWFRSYDHLHQTGELMD